MSTGGQVLRERDFHNDWASQISLEELKVRESFEACTALENRFVLRQMGNLRNKKILDLGCGAGETSVYFALKGAQVFASDISEGFLKIAHRLADQHETSLQAVQADASRIPYEDESFDFVFGNGVLHHVDLMAASREVSRVLKKGGKAFFIEPLPYNPAIAVYRKMAAAVRTEDEKPLSFKELNRLRPLFSSFEHREFWFFTLLIFFHFFFVRGWHPGKVRYWKKVIEAAGEYKKMFASLERTDGWILKTLPFLRPLCWNTVLTLTK